MRGGPARARPLHLVLALLGLWWGMDASAQVYNGTTSRVQINPHTLQPVTYDYVGNAAQYSSQVKTAGYEIVKYSPKANFVNALRAGATQFLDSKAITIAKTAARRIGPSLLVSVGASVVLGSLDYFYKTLKSSVGVPELDGFYSGTLNVYFYVQKSETYCSYVSGVYTTYVRVVLTGRVVAGGRNDDYTYSSTTEPCPSATDPYQISAAKLQQAQVTSLQRWAGRYPEGGAFTVMEGSRTYDPALNPAAVVTVYAMPSKSLADIIDTNPAALSALRDTILPRYMQDHEPTPAMLQQGTTWGGGTVRVQPGDTPPTINQVMGGPYNVTIDTDGDGYTDAQEDRSGSPMDDPAIIPGDLDADGIIDADDPDMDGDGYSNTVETAENSDEYNPESKPADLDHDGVPDTSDPDIDGDGVPNVDDYAPRDPNVTESPGDLDGDGIPDDQDPDRDGDGVPNADDPAPDDPTEPEDPDDKPIECDAGSHASADGKTCEPDTKPSDPLPGQPDFGTLTPTQPDLNPLEEAWIETVNKVKTDALEKFPFGISDKWFPKFSSLGQSACPPFVVPPLFPGGPSMTLNVCSGPVASWSHDFLRPFLAFFLVVGFVYGTARLVAQS